MSSKYKVESPQNIYSAHVQNPSSIQVLVETASSHLEYMRVKRKSRAYTCGLRSYKKISK